MDLDVTYDAAVIGGGFYGCVIATYLAARRGFNRVMLMEQESALLSRASYNNQARIHNGYHYPRHFSTAFRSRVNLPRFVRDFPEAAKCDFTKVYAIARHHSKLNAKQFERFCRSIGARLERAPESIRKLFESRLIEDVFLAEEFAFDAGRLREWARQELSRCGVETRLDTRVTNIAAHAGQNLRVDFQTAQGAESMSARYVFNCTYSGLNHVNGVFPGTKARLKHEITEMALMEPPPALKHLGITVMDGPFFSMMPFPARNLHTLSHVRYTPHSEWLDEATTDPYCRLELHDRATRVDRMVRDVARYMPAVLHARYVDSLFEVKTVLLKAEDNDARPILFERHESLPHCYAVLGGKIDNVYDVLERLDAEPLSADG